MDARILTHCNTGPIATAGGGTALGAIIAAARAGKRPHVFVDETRPLLQGARLTYYELQRAGVDATLIVDGAAAITLQRKNVDLVIVGADRIARNGDTANKIGTYGVAIAAAHHGIPFYVAAPRSTFDFSLETGAQIPIEERPAEEVTSYAGTRVAPGRRARLQPGVRRDAWPPDRRVHHRVRHPSAALRRVDPRTLGFRPNLAALTAAVVKFYDFVEKQPAIGKLVIIEGTERILAERALES